MLTYLVLILTPLACHAAPSLETDVVDFPLGDADSTVKIIVDPAIKTDNSSSIFELDRVGKYTWELLFEIDNSRNAREIRKEVEVITSIFCSYKEMKQSLEKSSGGSSAEASLGGKMFDIVDIRVTGALNDEVKLEYERISESNEEFVKSITKKNVYTVGAKSKLKLHRLVFNGPGILYQTDILILSSTPYEINDVRINFKVKLPNILKESVAYSKRPKGSII